MDKISKLEGKTTIEKKFTKKDRKIKKCLIYTFCLNPIRVVQDFCVFKGSHTDPVFLDEKYKIFNPYISGSSGNIYYYKPVKREMNEFGEYYSIEDEFFSSKLLKIITSHRDLVETPFVYLMKTEDSEGYSGLLSKFILRSRDDHGQQQNIKSRAYIYGLMVVSNEADHNPRNYLRDIEAGMGRIDHTSNFDHLKGFKGDPWDYKDFTKWVNPKNMFEEWRFMASEVFQRNSNGDLHKLINQLERDPSKVDDQSIVTVLKNYEQLGNFENFKEKLNEFRNVCKIIYDNISYDSELDEKIQEIRRKLNKVLEKMTRNMLIEDSQWKIVSETNFMYFLRGVVDYLQVPDNILDLVFNVENNNTVVKSKKTELISTNDDCISTPANKVNSDGYQSNSSSSASKSSKSENLERITNLKNVMKKFFQKSIDVFYSKLNDYHDDNLLDIDWNLFFELGTRKKNGYSKKYEKYL